MATKDEGIWRGCGHPVKPKFLCDNPMCLESSGALEFLKNNPKELCMECWRKENGYELLNKCLTKEAARQTGIEELTQEAASQKLSHRLRFLLKLYAYQKNVSKHGMTWKQVENVRWTGDEKRDKAIASKCYDGLFDLHMLDEEMRQESKRWVKRLKLTDEACAFAEKIMKDLKLKKIRWDCIELEA